MKPLPKGISGFDAPEDGVDLTFFASACYAATRRVSGRVFQVRAAYEPVPKNFHEAIIDLRDRPAMVRVLCNAHFPIVVFAEPELHDGDLRLKFEDCSELANALRSDFFILSQQEADSAVSNELLLLLGETELHQIRYWQPQRLGDVIFNSWD